MREIKFRAWDGEVMKHSLAVARPQMADVLTVMTDEKFAQETYHLKEWKLMQYTGLKDRNGAKIYEGDFVKYPYNGEDYIMPIVFDGGEFYPWENGFMPDEVLYQAKDDFHYSNIEDAEDEFEVIGNIYQNPELLNG